MSRPPAIVARSVSAFGVVAALSLTLAGCSSSPVRAYVDDAIAILDKGLYADTPKWAAAVARLRPELYEKDSIRETYFGIGELGRVAGGAHTFLVDPGSAAAMEKATAPDAIFPVPTVSTRDGISTVTLPAFSADEQESINRYQDTGVGAVRSAASATSCGWIIDLRTNSGGSAYPMLSTIAPLLHDGHVLGFRDRYEKTEWIDVANGNVHAPASYGVQSATADFSISQPVAIVTGPITASAAETVVVAFAGQAQTVRIGDPTAGMTTANDTFDLPDGAFIALSIAYYVDRDQTVYDGPIEPDIPHPSPPTTVLDAASDWLRSQC